MKSRTNTKQTLLAIVLVFTLLLGCLPVERLQAADSYSAYSAFRIAIDGKIYQTKAYVSKKKQEVFVTPTAAKKLLGKTPMATVKIRGKKYANLTKLAQQCKVSSCEYDAVMHALYVWTNDPISDAERIKYYGLGTPSSKTITYKQFFQLLDKTVKIADAAKLKKWQGKFKTARSSGRTMSRAEGMLAILYMVTTLGGDYPEFNADWSRINDAVGEKCWDEMDQIKNLYQYMENPYPYHLGGFKKDDYVYEWDAIGVAYRYGYGRKSLVNGKPLFDYDAQKQSMHLQEMMTYEDALNATSRLLDSCEASKKAYISVTNKKAVTCDSSVLTPQVLARAKKMDEIKNGDCSDCAGLVLNGCDFDNRTIDAWQFSRDAKRMSEWGFHDVRYMITYQSLFDKKASKVDENALKELDQIVASAIRYNIHLNLTTFTLPGRWAGFDPETYTSTGEFDLFLNEERQKEAYAVWHVLAKRYRDVPAAALSFCPIWEAQNYNLSTGLPAEIYTPEDVAAVYEKMVGVIKSYRKDRVVVCEATPANDAQDIVDQSKATKEAVKTKYDNTQMTFNFCENPYVYAEMTATEGDHIDNQNHSMFKPAYPTTIYGVKSFLGNGEMLELKGNLVKDTTLKLYLSDVQGNGNFSIVGDGKELYSEKLTTKKYQTDALLSRFYPYATSKKCISIKLSKTVKSLTISYSGDGWQWSGMDVTLPEKYAVKRWWNQSGYDLFLEGKEESLEAMSPKLKDTSNIMICPNADQGTVLTIHSDIMFTSDVIVAQANKQTIDQWGETVAAFAPHALVRCEGASFCNGTDLTSALKYYKDFLEMCKRRKLGWLMNDYDIGGMLSTDPQFLAFKFGGGKLTLYEKDTCYGQELYLQKDLLKLFQTYAEKPKKI